MANGQVGIGLSKPIIAKYTASGTSVTYSDAQYLARAVSASYDLETSDANVFYADNVASETVPGSFTGGTLTLTVDGMLPAAEKVVYGLGTAETVSEVAWQGYGASDTTPYLGIGFVVKKLSGGVESYVPVVFPKVRFNLKGEEASTMEESVEFQTQELEASIMRDDTTAQNWKRVGAAQTTEAAALAAIQAVLTTIA